MKIVLSGTVGIGKTATITKLIEKLKQLNYEVIFHHEKSVDSVYLNLFYSNPKKWGFITQLDFLFNRFKQFLNDEILETKNSNKTNTITIYDRHLLDDYIFAELNTINGNINVQESIIYQSIYKEMLEKMNNEKKSPDYFILLKAPLEIILQRLKQRGRVYEILTEIDYWNKLHINYYDRPMVKNHFQINSKNYFEIDNSSKTIEQVADEIISIILKKPL